MLPIHLYGRVCVYYDFTQYEISNFLWGPDYSGQTKRHHGGLQSTSSAGNFPL